MTNSTRGRSALLSFSLALGSTVLTSCSTLDVPASRPGMSHRETETLIKTYYWQRKFPVPSYTDEALDALLAASADPTLDGERAEVQASAVAVALTVVGDQRFAHSLSQQPATVRHRVGAWISDLWTHHQLRYPQTQALLK